MFLTQRKQKVTSEGIVSNRCDVISGVPQGTALGPLLFLLYVNDLLLCISSAIKLFADDRFLFRTITGPMDNQTSVRMI